jgi:hypothetical protein
MMLKSKAQKTSKKEIEKAAGLTRSSFKNIRKKHKNIHPRRSKGNKYRGSTKIPCRERYENEPR